MRMRHSEGRLTVHLHLLCDFACVHDLSIKELGYPDGVASKTCISVEAFSDGPIVTIARHDL